MNYQTKNRIKSDKVELDRSTDKQYMDNRKETEGPCTTVITMKLDYIVATMALDIKITFVISFGCLGDVIIPIIV